MLCLTRQKLMVNSKKLQGTIISMVFFFEMFFIFSFFQSNAKLRKLYPDYKFTSMEDGIQASVDWFVANYEAARK